MLFLGHGRVAAWEGPRRVLRQGRQAQSKGCDRKENSPYEVRLKVRGGENHKSMAENFEQNRKNPA
jgi:hypothetical protein